MQDIAWKQIFTFGGIGLVVGVALGALVLAPILKKKDKPETTND